MRQVQIYLKGLDASGNLKDFRLDLYKDESIEVTSSIKQAKDIGTIYSDFTQSFTVPASSNNNKVFKHFYKFDISTGFFDARLRQDAFIEINSLPYRKGKLFLSSVNMKNNKPMFYKIVFYGSVASLKDIFRDDLLSSLDFSDFHHDFDYTEIKTIFKNGKTVDGDSEALIYPLITSKKRLFYDDTIGNTDEENFDGNLYIPSTGNDIDRYHKRGISQYDLKPAIKIYQLIKLIEEKYDIVLIPNDTSGTKDFLSKHNEAITNLYMWMSAKAGNIYGEEGEEDYAFKNIATGYTDFNSPVVDNVDYGFFYVSGDDDEIINVESVYDHQNEFFAASFYGDNEDGRIRFYVRVVPSSGEENINYRVKLVDIDTGNVQVSSGKGTYNCIFNLPVLAAGDDAKRYKIEFSSQTAMTNTRIKPAIYRKNIGANNQEEMFNSTSFDTDVSKVFINEQIPEIKIIDFLNGLFKMFNLVAYIIEDETDSEYSTSTTKRVGTPNAVKIMTYDDYYADAVNNNSNGIIDVTKYIDVSTHDVDTILPFREINFEYEETDIILIEQHKKISNGKIFGNANNVIESEFGQFFHKDVYDIEVPFSHFKYERILGTDIQWGYAAGGSFSTTAANYSNTNNIVAPKGNYDPEDVKPLLFYGIKTTTTYLINFNDTIDDVEAVSTYFRPSNGNEDSSVSDDIDDVNLLATYYLNFGIDLDEWSGAVALNSLYGLFYRNFIKMILEQTKRMHQFEAFLPPSFIVNYKLNDQLKIQDTVYRINSLEINLTTGKSSLELINLNSDEII